MGTEKAGQWGGEAIHTRRNNTDFYLEQQLFLIGGNFPPVNLAMHEDIFVSTGCCMCGRCFISPFR